MASLFQCENKTISVPCRSFQQSGESSCAFLWFGVPDLTHPSGVCSCRNHVNCDLSLPLFFVWYLCKFRFYFIFSTCGCCLRCAHGSCSAPLAWWVCVSVNDAFPFWGPKGNSIAQRYQVSLNKINKLKSYKISARSGMCRQEMCRYLSQLYKNNDVTKSAKN